jgi:hypothetical protein
MNPQIDSRPPLKHRLIAFWDFDSPFACDIGLSVAGQEETVPSEKQDRVERKLTTIVIGRFFTI